MDQGKRLPDLPIKSLVADANDKIIFIYSSTANTAEAQTALITTENLFKAVPHALAELTIIANTSITVLTPQNTWINVVSGWSHDLTPFDAIANVNIPVSISGYIE